MAVDHSHCCEPETGDATTTGLDPEYELDFDPTLNSCCERDRAKHSFELKAKAALQRVDRVDLRTRLETGVLGRRPQECIEGSESSIGDPESDSHEDALLSRLRLQRLQEVQKATPSSFGSGIVSTVSEAQAMEDVRQGDGNHVIHLAAEGDAVGQELEEHLDQVAFECKGARFLRVILSRQSRLPPMLGVPHAPALLVFNEGALTAKSLVAKFTKDGTLLQEQVSKFLRQTGVDKDGESDSDPQSEGEDQSDWQEPCEICGRRYFHEHINNKPMYRNAVSDCSSDENN